MTKQKTIKRELINVALSRLKEYANNPRYNEAAVDAVAESIRQCEYVSPIVVDEDFEILAGHTRRKALLKLGKTEDCVLQITGLTNAQKRKFRLLDNKTNEFASWDAAKLEEELADLDFEDFDFHFDGMNDDFMPADIATVDADEIESKFNVCILCEDADEMEKLKEKLGVDFNEFSRRVTVRFKDIR